MSSDLDRYLAVFLTGFGITCILTPRVRTLALWVGAVDLPNERRPHRNPTARGGGLAVVLGVYAAWMMAIGWQWLTAGAQLDFRSGRHFLLASLVLLLVGLVDDLRGLDPWLKLAGQTLAAALISLSGLRFERVLGCALPPSIDSILVVLWIVGVINAFNLIDGLDGLACGLAIVSAVGLGSILALGPLSGQIHVLVGLIGACLGFLRYNFPPASIFLGDTGSMFLGFVLGVNALWTVTQNPFSLSFCIPLLVLGVPIYDEVLAIWRRLVRSWSRKRPAGEIGVRTGIFQPDLDHLHHRLLKAGLSSGRVAVLLCAINAGLVIFGVLISHFSSRAAGIFLLALLASVYVLMRRLAVMELRETGRAILSRLRCRTHATLAALAYPVWDVTCMVVAVALAMWVFEGARTGFRQSWLLELPVWVTPTFSMMTASRIYVTIWARARVLDLLLLVATLVTGLMLSLAMALLIDPEDASRWIMRAWVMGAISHPAIVCVRVFYRVTEEGVLYLRRTSELSAGSERVLVYGAGSRCQLLLRERESNGLIGLVDRTVAGLIDDDASLHSRWVYGYPVLGGLKELTAIIAQNRVTSIVITTKLPPEATSTLRSIALQHQVQLIDWSAGVHPVCSQSEPLTATADELDLIPIKLPGPKPLITQTTAAPVIQSPTL